MISTHSLLNNMFLCSTDIFLPTPDSLLVNLNECKEVGILFLDLSFGFGIMNCKPEMETTEWEKSQESSFCHPRMWKYTALILWFSSSLCRICWRAYLLYFKRPWKPSLHWVQRSRLASSCYHRQEVACLSSRHNCLTSVQGPCSPEKTPTRGHPRR